MTETRQNDALRFQVSDLPSPSLVFYKDRIARNIERAIELAGGAQRLRPHIKTHKTKEIVGLLMDRGVDKFKCATIAEAELLGMAGAREALLAYPLVGPNQRRFFELVEKYPKTRFQAVCDNLELAQQLSILAKERTHGVEIFLEYDPGLHRTGVGPEEAEELYVEIAGLSGINLLGIHAYDGQNHQNDPVERRNAADLCFDVLSAIRERLEVRHFAVPTVVLGGTPTFHLYAIREGVEVSPGTCFLQDFSYLTKFKDLPFEPAAFVLSRVVSLHPQQGTFTLDLGYKAISSDPQGVRGVIFSRASGWAEPVFQNEEHWVFRSTDGELPRIGEELLVLPTHICPSVALHDNAAVLDEAGRILETWEILGRKRTMTI